MRALGAASATALDWTESPSRPPRRCRRRGCGPSRNADRYGAAQRLAGDDIPGRGHGRCTRPARTPPWTLTGSVLVVVVVVADGRRRLAADRLLDGDGGRLDRDAGERLGRRRWRSSGRSPAGSGPGRRARAPGCRRPPTSCRRRGRRRRPARPPRGSGASARRPAGPRARSPDMLREPSSPASMRMCERSRCHSSTAASERRLTSIGALSTRQSGPREPVAKRSANDQVDELARDDDLLDDLLAVEVAAAPSRSRGRARSSSLLAARRRRPRSGRAACR